MRTMKRLKRISLIREDVEAQLKKNERRIQAIAEESYKLRQLLEQIDSLKPQTPYVKPKEGEKEPTANEKAIELDKKIDAVMDAETKEVQP